MMGIKTVYVAVNGECRITSNEFGERNLDWKNIAVAFSLPHGTPIGNADQPELYAAGKGYIIADKFIPDAKANRSNDDCIRAILSEVDMDKINEL